MQEFSMWFNLGITHIISLEGIDHLMFILNLSFVYAYNEIRRIFLLISGFTIGHTFSLVYGSYISFKINSNLIEFLIPLTIVISSISNLLPKKKNILTLSLICLFFGLIHGLAFSNSICSLLGHTNQALWALLYFNLGIEAAQVLILISCFILIILITKQFHIAMQKFKQSISILIALIGVFICYNRLDNLI